MSEDDAPTPSALRRNPNVEIEQVADGYIIHDPSTQRLHYLNVSSAVIFELIDQYDRPEDLAKILQETFDLAEPPVEDVRECLDNLRDEGLIVSAGPVSTPVGSGN